MGGLVPVSEARLVAAAASQDTAKLVLAPARGSNAILIGACLTLAVASGVAAFIVSANRPPLAIAAIFLVLIAGGLWLITQPRWNNLLLSRHGLAVRAPLLRRSFAWGDIESFALASVQGPGGSKVTRVVIALAPAARRSRFPQLRRLLQLGSDFQLPQNYGQSPDDLLALLRAWHSRLRYG